MRKRIPILLLSLCLLSGCGRGKPPKEPTACVSTADCVLCGRTETGPWGQNNVGLISLNTFDMLPIEINRYSDGGELIEESTGTFKLRNFQSGENGFHVSLMEEADRGYALLSVTLGKDGAMEREKAAAFLCEDCLEGIDSEGVGLGAVDFVTGRVRAFDEQTCGFGLGDFYIYCDWEKGGKEVELLVFYSPLRYEDEI